MNVVRCPEGQRPKATDVSPWYGVSGKIPLDRGFLNDGYYVRFCVKRITELFVIGSQRRCGLRQLT